MKIEYYNGCTSSNISIDDEYLGEEPDRQRMLEIANLILNSLSNTSLEYTLKDLIQSNSTDYKDLGYCDQCGDNPCLYTIDIDSPLE